MTKNTKDVLECVNGYSCPNCWIISSSKSLVKIEESGKDEIHKCKGCKTIYIIHKN